MKVKQIGEFRVGNEVRLTEISSNNQLWHPNIKVGDIGLIEGLDVDPYYPESGIAILDMGKHTGVDKSMDFFSRELSIEKGHAMCVNTDYLELVNEDMAEKVNRIEMINDKIFELNKIIYRRRWSFIRDGGQKTFEEFNKVVEKELREIEELYNEQNQIKWN